MVHEVMEKAMNDSIGENIHNFTRIVFELLPIFSIIITELPTRKERKKNSGSRSTQNELNCGRMKTVDFSHPQSSTNCKYSLQNKRRRIGFFLK